jgi:glycosyltransferase involved in cell wall biosynthesis
MPQYVLEMADSLSDHSHTVFHWADNAPQYDVQLRQIRERHGYVLGDGDIPLLLSLISKSDIVHFHEPPQLMFSMDQLARINSVKGKASFYLTCHGAHTNWTQSLSSLSINHVVCVSDWQSRQLPDSCPRSVWKYPIKVPPSCQSPMAGSAINIVQIGLWAEHKNQKFTIDVAKLLGPRYHFHFLGLLAPNFQHYWSDCFPLPSNCTNHGQVHRPSDFLAHADGFIFPSTDECNPLALREALGAKLHCFVNPLDIYDNEYQESGLITWVDTQEKAAGEIQKHFEHQSRSVFQCGSV